MGGKTDYSKLILKKDWLTYRDKLVDKYVNICIDKMNFELMIGLTDKEIAKFPDEVDEAVEEVLEEKDA